MKNNMSDELLPCPFCGSTNLVKNLWNLDDDDYEDGEQDAVECNDCYGAAPLKVWNERSA